MWRIQRIWNLFTYGFPWPCFCFLLYVYVRQRNYYELKLRSIGGLFDMDFSLVNMEELARNLTFVKKGGWYHPRNCTCQADKKVAIIIPYRDRSRHLGIFLRYMHPFLKKQEFHYRIFIIEQANGKLFNRAKLFNVGFMEAKKVDNFNCFIFHDVDLLPLSNGNEYFCPTSPRHMSVAVDTMDFGIPYEGIFGGVSAVNDEHFFAVNGYPNRYWGWGGEDDDMFNRLRSLGHKITSPSAINGIYTMMFHTHSISEEFPERYDTLRKWEEFKNTDGLSSLKYEVLKRTDEPLYTLISCDI
ncbi:beta-1,4-galactosyltransferase 1-like [Xenia sp. Carnegie-2017]|uniref:beta-1,4-galactosyltransferase 1-like n=1 Tax=Xenia sp. Carnegie-2017 TaxID=2897299 RepID=UPI001F036D14|nr:beta-1,4-galactosyltransferase 1-like [Xenia sp. Carnegie-2017]